MLRVVLDAERPAHTMRVNEAHGDEIRVPVEMTPVGNGEGFVVDWVLDGTPDVDDTNAASEETGSFVAEMIMHSLDASIKCLINVNTFLAGKGS